MIEPLGHQVASFPFGRRSTIVTPTRISPQGSIQLVTHRTSQGEHLLLPAPEVNQNILYLLGYMQQRHSLGIHAVSVLADHLYSLLTDLLGDRIQRFNLEFFSLMARSMNCYRKRRENFWNTRKPSCVLVAPRAEDVVQKAAYVIANPVQAKLVSSAAEWPGVCTLADEMGRLVLEIERPRFFYDENGPMPESTRLEITVPEVCDASSEELRERIIEEVKERERAVQSNVRLEKSRFLGAEMVLHGSPHARSAHPGKPGDLNPRVACKDRRLRARFLEWLKARQAQYEELRQRLLEGGQDLVFPEGTFALHFRGGQRRTPWRGCPWQRLMVDP